MDAFKLCALALICLCAALFLKQLKADMLPPLRIAFVILFSFCAIFTAEPLISYLRELGQMSLLSGHLERLFKAVGLAILTQCCANLCKESGENGLASGVETIGKIELLLLSLPLLEEIFSIASELLTLGGNQ